MKRLLEIISLIIFVIAITTSCKKEEVKHDSTSQPEDITVTNITLSHDTLIFTLGDNPKQLTATIEPNNATDKELVWSSSDSRCATVDSDGLVKALEAGEVMITAKTGDGGAITDSCLVMITSLPSYTIGELFPDATNPIGVVVSLNMDNTYYNTTTMSGVEGMIVSLDESAALKWSEELIKLTANSKSNGLNNMRVILSHDPELNSYPIIKWVDDLNKKGDINTNNYQDNTKGAWYLPSIDELREVCAGFYGLQMVGYGVIPIEGQVSIWNKPYQMAGISSLLFNDRREIFNGLVGDKGDKLSDSDLELSFWSSTEYITTDLWGTPEKSSYNLNIKDSNENTSPKTLTLKARAVMRF